MAANGLASDDPAPREPEAATDCWVFDVDGCLVDSLTGTSLRPGARDLLQHLARQRRHVLLWSAGGAGYARSRAEQFGLDHLVRAYFAKDGRRPDGYYVTAHLPLSDHPTVFVDDRPEDLAPDLQVLAVSPYLSDDPFDRGLQQVFRRAGLAGLSCPPEIGCP
jgi:long-chain acyl-CoA synthetase